MKPFKTILFNRNFGKNNVPETGTEQSSDNISLYDKKTLSGYDHIYFNANASSLLTSGEITLGYVPPMFQIGNFQNYIGLPNAFKTYKAVYHIVQGSNPCTNLQSGATYYIRVSPNDPRKIRLYTSLTNAQTLNSLFQICGPSDPATPDVVSLHSLRIIDSFSTSTNIGYNSTTYKITPDCDDLYIPNDKKIIMVLRNFVYTPSHIVDDDLNPKLGSLKLKTTVNNSHFYEGNVTTQKTDTILLSYNFNQPFEFNCNDNDICFPIDRTTFLKGEYELSLDEQKLYNTPRIKTDTLNFRRNNYTLRLDFFLVPLDYKCPKILFCDSDNAVKTIQTNTVNISYRDSDNKNKRLYFDAQSTTCVNLPTNLFLIPNHGLKTGDTVIYDFNSTYARNLENQKFQPLTTATGSLSYNQTVYYVYVQDASIFGVSTTSANPTQSDCVDITAVASGTTNYTGMSWHYFLKVTNITGQQIVSSYRYKFSGLREETDNKGMKRLRLKYFNRLKNIETQNTASGIGKIKIMNICEHDDKIHTTPLNEMTEMTIDNIIMTNKFTSYMNDGSLEYDNRREDVFIQHLSKEDDITLDVSVICNEVVSDETTTNMIVGDFANTHHTLIILLYD